MDNTLNRAVVNKVQDLSEQLETVKSMTSFEPKWSDPAPIDSIRIGKGLGVYRIIYKPEEETKSIGQGVVAQRRTRHKGVFKNGGKDIISLSGATSSSQTGQKMFAYDNNLDNWWMEFCFIPQKALCAEYEKLLQKNEEPEFNMLSMGGNN